jgi:putative addiction module component (TIGR02574 family)
MSPTAEDVLKQALTLDEKDRASVAGALIESLDTQEDPDAEEAWDAEIRRRVEGLESGTVETIPWSEVRKRLFADEVISKALRVADTAQLAALYSEFAVEDRALAEEGMEEYRDGLLLEASRSIKPKKRPEGAQE